MAFPFSSTFSLRVSGRSGSQPERLAHDLAARLEEAGYGIDELDQAGLRFGRSRPSVQFVSWPRDLITSGRVAVSPDSAGALVSVRLSFVALAIGLSVVGIPVGSLLFAIEDASMPFAILRAFSVVAGGVALGAWGATAGFRRFLRRVLDDQLFMDVHADVA